MSPADSLSLAGYGAAPSRRNEPESWAASFRARSEAAAINEQPDLFGGMNV